MKFVSRDTGYGMSTDMLNLPVGTKFLVNNGLWKGTIVMGRDNKKYIHTKVHGVEPHIIPVTNKTFLSVSIIE